MTHRWCTYRFSSLSLTCVPLYDPVVWSETLPPSPSRVPCLLSCIDEQSPVAGVLFPGCCTFFKLYGRSLRNRSGRHVFGPTPIRKGNSFSTLASSVQLSGSSGLFQTLSDTRTYVGFLVVIYLFSNTSTDVPRPLQFDDPKYVTN